MLELAPPVLSAATSAIPSAATSAVALGALVVPSRIETYRRAPHLVGQRGDARSF